MIIPFPLAVIPAEIVKPDIDLICDTIEMAIAAEQNQDYASPLAQQLLDLEADIVLRDYYAHLTDEATNEWRRDA